jgi:hypothetical protein
MPLSHKEQALRIIEQLPEDVTRDDVIEALSTRLVPGAESQASGATLESTGEDPDTSAVDVVTYHLEREGHMTVLVPDRPVPPLRADIVNQLIEDMRRERENRWLHPSKDGE